jgi:hypothetical protein
VNSLGELLSCHFSHLLSLHIGLGSCFLVSFLACLFFLAVGFSCEVVIQSLHFLFIISKIQKKNLFLAFYLWNLHFWIFFISFGILGKIALHLNCRDCILGTKFRSIPSH